MTPTPGSALDLLVQFTRVGGAELGGAGFRILTRSSEDSCTHSNRHTHTLINVHVCTWVHVLAVCQECVSLCCWCTGFTHRPTFSEMCPLASLRHIFILAAIAPFVCMCVCACLVMSMDCSLPGFSVHWISYSRILEWVFPSPGDLLDPGIEPKSAVLAGRFISTVPPGKPNC